MNSVLLDLGFIKIYWYSFFILLAVIVGGFLAFKEAKKNNIPESFMINYFFYLIFIGIIGARIYYVVFNFDLYKSDLLSIFKVWEGGLAIHGGLIAGAIFTFFYTQKYNIKFLKLLDIAAVSVIISQAIGRWGNFFNSEAYGPETTLNFLQNLHIPKFVIDGMYINGTYYQPTFFYESLWCIFGFIMMILIRKNKKLILGNLISFYLIWYGFGRFLIESLRTDSLMLGNFKVAQIVSILMILTGIILIIITSFKNNKIYYHGEKNNGK